MNKVFPIGTLLSVKPKYKKQILVTGTNGTGLMKNIEDRDAVICKLSKLIGNIDLCKINEIKGDNSNYLYRKSSWKSVN